MCVGGRRAPKANNKSQSKTETKTPFREARDPNWAVQHKQMTFPFDGEGEISSWSSEGPFQLNPQLRPSFTHWRVVHGPVAVSLRQIRFQAAVDRLWQRGHFRQGGFLFFKNWLFTQREKESGVYKKGVMWVSRVGAVSSEFLSLSSLSLARPASKIERVCLTLWAPSTRTGARECM